LSASAELLVTRATLCVNAVSGVVQCLSVCHVGWWIVSTRLEISSNFVFSPVGFFTTCTDTQGKPCQRGLKITGVDFSVVISRPWSRDSSALEFILSRSRSRSRDLKKVLTTTLVDFQLKSPFMSETVRDRPMVTMEL